MPNPRGTSQALPGTYSGLLPRRIRRYPLAGVGDGQPAGARNGLARRGGREKLVVWAPDPHQAPTSPVDCAQRSSGIGRRVWETPRSPPGGRGVSSCDWARLQGHSRHSGICGIVGHYENRASVTAVMDIVVRVAHKKPRERTEVRSLVCEERCRPGLAWGHSRSASPHGARVADTTCKAEGTDAGERRERCRGAAAPPPSCGVSIIHPFHLRSSYAYLCVPVGEVWGPEATRRR